MGRGIEKLHPELIPVCNKFTTMCRERGLNVLITETFRTKKEQEELYSQGRTKPGSIVTNAPYPKSPHCWGVAFDFCRGQRGREYDDSDGFFARCGAVGKELGLFWGGDFKSFTDKPHLELAKYLPNNSCNALIEKYGTPERFMAAWKEEEEVTQEQFNSMMEAYLAQRGREEASDWAGPEIEKAKSAGVTDGSRPKAFATREEVMAMIIRAGER